MMSRRDLLAGTLAAPAVTAAGTVRRPFFEAHDLPIGIQLFPIAADLKVDFLPTLRRVAAIGYTTVETAGLYGISAAEFRAALDAAGLTCRSMHVHGRPLLNPLQNLEHDIDAVAADAHTLGARHVVMPLFLMPTSVRPKPGADAMSFIRAGGAAMGADDYRRTAAFLNDRGSALQRHKLRLGYHNHNFEFTHFGDQTGLDIMLTETDPELVDFELDVGWAVAAGINPLALLERHPRRFTQVHVKDIAASTRPNVAMEQDPVEIGRGSIDWRQVLPIAYRAGTRGFFIEQEPPFTGSRLDAMAANYRYLATLVA